MSTKCSNPDCIEGHLVRETNSVEEGGIVMIDCGLCPDCQKVTSKTPKKKKSVEKQERLVTALWTFAANLQLNPNEGCVITRTRDGVKVSSKHIETAMEEIMDSFGYKVTPIY